MSEQARKTVERLLRECGITPGGPEPTDLQVHDKRFYARVLSQGSLGLGESYMDGWWDAADLDGFVYRLLKARVDRHVRSWRDVAAWVTATVFNLQRRSRAFQVGEQHYDIGNDLYAAMLDPRMMYSCAYWEGVDTLAGAQEAKLDLVFRKLDLRPGQRVLDIGSGWGGALQYAVERYGVQGVGVTVSREQAELARQRCAGLPVEFRLQDYRDLDERFDHLYSIGMFEHVGVKNYRTYMEVAHRCLKPEGRFLLHTIGKAGSSRHTDPWLHRYIFPNSLIPSQEQIARAAEGLFLIQHWQRIGPHYDTTLLAWRDNFERAWPSLKDRYGERFYRMWRYYLSACAASFRAHRNDVWQVLLVPVPR